MNVNFVADTNIVCVGYPLAFTDMSVADTILAWSWNFGDSGTDTLQNPIHTYLVPGVYTVALTATSPNTTKTKTIVDYIIVRQVPNARIEYSDTTFLPSFQYYFEADVVSVDTFGYNYFWSFDQGSYSPGDSVNVYTFPSAGNHYVSLIVESGLGCRDTVMDTIPVTDEIVAPNLFTPNGDQINDVFFIKTNGVTMYTLVVYNRWGAIMFQVTARRVSWDGYSSAGVEVPAGTYYYTLSPEDGTGETFKGYLQLAK
jgi:gliding motility-associated-like protein